MMRIFDEIVVTLSAYPALSLLVKGTVVVALALAGAWLARKSRASVRHALLASAFGVLLALPIVSFFAKPVPISVPVAAADGIVSPLFDVVPVSSSRVPVIAGSGAAPPDPGPSLPPLSTMLLYGWLIGSVFFFTPIVRGLLQVRTLRRYCLPWRQGQMVADELVSGTRRRVDVLLHESLSGPMTCGFLRPAVILPVDAQSWDEHDLERALVHELEHVRRYDWAVHCLARLACTLYWFHPLVWMAWRRLVLEAERSCDDAVLRDSEPTAYADQLVGLARRRRLQGVGKSPVLAMANRSDLAARIGALLDRRQARGRAGSILVAAVYTAAMVVVLTVSPLRVIAAPQSSPVQSSVATPIFEVASVKPSRSSEGCSIIEPLPGGGLRIDCVPLKTILNWAYQVQLYQISGGPAWLASENWTILAKSDASVSDTTAAPYEEMTDPERRHYLDLTRQRLQALLASRFQLALHRETVEQTVYALTVARNGPKLTLSPDQTRSDFLRRGRGQITGVGARMEILAQYLGIELNRPVLDSTGLSNHYDFKLEWTPDRPVGADSATDKEDPANAPGPTLFTAIQEQLGLRLEMRKGPVEVLVIDHVERPLEN